VGDVALNPEKEANKKSGLIKKATTTLKNTGYIFLEIHTKQEQLSSNSLPLATIRNAAKHKRQRAIQVVATHPADELSISREYDIHQQVNTSSKRSTAESRFKHLLVQKKQCVESLILGRGRDLSVDSQKTEKVGNLWLRHFHRVLHVVKTNKKSYPVTVCFFSFSAVMLYSNGGFDLFH